MPQDSIEQRIAVLQAHMDAAKPVSTLPPGARRCGLCWLALPHRHVRPDSRLTPVQATHRP